MKRIIAIALFLTLTLTLPVMAASSAFTTIKTSPDTELIDATADQGSNNHPVEYVDGFGIGYTYLDDIVVFKDLDFGTNGANKCTIGFAYGIDDPPYQTLKLYVDDYSKAEVGSVRCENTGGWGEAEQKEFTFDANIPAGIHTVYLKFAEAASGSLYSISFTEAPAPATEAPATDAPTVDAPVTDNPKTFDDALLYLSLSVAAVFALVVTYRKIKVK